MLPIIKYPGRLTGICLLCFAFLASWGQAEKNLYLYEGEQTPVKPKQRCALVIGNSRYQNMGVLPNPAHDADSMYLVLKKLGFDVNEYKNLNKRDFRKAIDDFGEKMKDYEVCLFYYSGHGAEAKGTNYLFPVDAAPKTESDAEYDCIAANLVLGKMDDAQAKTKIVLLDACRNNPFQSSWYKDARSGGLAQMNAPTGTFIGFAASPGKTAADGEDNNGPYTKAIMHQIEKTDVSITDLFTNVNREVRKLTRGTQVPFMNSSLDDMFFFSKKATVSEPINKDDLVKTTNTSGYDVRIMVLNKKNQAPIEGAKIEFTNLSNQHTDSALTDKYGQYVFRPIPGASYFLNATKKVPETSTYKYRATTTKYTADTMAAAGKIWTLTLALDSMSGIAIKIENIYFDYEKWFIRPDAATELDKIVKIMRENPTMEIELLAHADCHEFNGVHSKKMEISVKRGEAAVEYLVSQGIEAKRMISAGYGDSRPIDECVCQGTKGTPCTEEELQANRRIEFRVLRF